MLLFEVSLGVPPPWRHPMVRFWGGSDGDPPSGGPPLPAELLLGASLLSDPPFIAAVGLDVLEDAKKTAAWR